MTRSESQELVEFLGPKLDAIEERLTRAEVLAEDNRHQIQIVAEGLGALRSEMTEGFRAVRSEMAEGFGAVWSEFKSVRSEFKSVRSEMAAGFDAQERLIRGLGSRVGRLEA